MASESVAIVKSADVMDNLPSREVLENLRTNEWAFDDTTHHILWESQCILALIDEAMGDNANNVEGEKVRLAINGVERLIAGAIARAGWTGIGWEGR